MATRCTTSAGVLASTANLLLRAEKLPATRGNSRSRSARRGELHDSGGLTGSRPWQTDATRRRTVRVNSIPARRDAARSRRNARASDEKGPPSKDHIHTHTQCSTATFACEAARAVGAILFDARNRRVRSLSRIADLIFQIHKAKRGCPHPCVFVSDRCQRSISIA